MDADRWQRVSSELDALLDLEGDARTTRLEALRAEDAELAAEVERLLAHEQTHDPRIDTPLVTAPPGPREGEAVGPYRLDSLLGEGGMGQVWKAMRVDGLHSRPVALKLLRPGLADPNLRLRFSREREILARLAHPHIARLLDAGIDGSGQPYLALDYVDGQGILAYTRTRHLDIHARLQLFRQVCDAVSHAHANLVVHRDLKPSNIMVTPDGQVHLLDFGIAKLLDDSAEPIEHTRTGLRPFTLHYAAPEQVRGEAVTTKTDVYSLGVVLYELLTGGKPYRLKRESSAQWEDAILAADPMRPSSAVLRVANDGLTSSERRRHARALSGDLDNIVLKALAKDPAQRYASAEALASDLQRFLEGLPVLARPQSLGYRARKFLSRHRWPIATGTGIATLLVIFLGVALWQRGEAVRETARAQALQNFMVGLFENADATQTGKPVDVATLIDAAEARGERELGLQPRAHAELLGMIARIRIALGQYARASTVLARQHVLLEALPDAPSSLTLEAGTQRGRVQRLLGDSNACVKTLQPLATLANNEQAQLPAHVADFDSQYARCLRSTGDRAYARRLFERSLVLRKDALGDDIGVVENLTDLAALSLDAGDYPGALQGFRAALAQLRAIAGNRHPLSIDILRSMGTTQRAMHSDQAAIASFAEALELSEHLQGPRHPTTIALRRQLAGAYSAQGRYVDAQRELELASRAIAQQPQGVANAVRAASDLGQVAFELGELEPAHEAYQRAIRLAASPSHAAAQFDALLEDAAVQSELAHPQAALRETEAARRLLATQSGGLANGAQGRLDLRVGEIFVAAGNPAAALPFLQSAAIAQGTRGSDAQAVLLHAQAQLATQLPNLVQAQQKLDVAAGVARQQGPAVVPASLGWRLQAYAADAACRHDPADGRKRFDGLLAELHAARPEGARVLRETQRLSDGCKFVAPPAPAHAPAKPAVARPRPAVPARRVQPSRDSGKGT